MIHEPSGQPIKYLKGIETERGFEEVPEEEIIKGYEHTKGHHVLIKPEELDEQESGKFEPQKMPNEYAQAIHELVQAKVEQRAPAVQIETEERETPKVVNIMDALKKSMQAKGQMRVESETQCVRAQVRPRLRIKFLLHRHGRGLRRGARLISLHMHR